MAAGSIVVDLLLKTGTFETDTNRAAKNLKALQKEAEKIGAAIGVAFAAVATASVLLVKHSIDTMDAMSKLSQQTGTAVESLSALAYAAGLSGVNQEALGSAMVKLSKNMSDAAIGIGVAGQSFDALGLSVKNADGTLKGSDQVIGEIANKFAGYKDSAEKTAIAVGIFGRAGAQLIPLLNGGADGLSQMTDEARKLGVVLDGETSKAAEEFNDNLTRLEKAIEGIANRAATSLLPALKDVSSALVDMAKSEAFVETTTGVVKAAISAIIVVFQTLSVVASDVGFVFLGVGREIGAWAAQLAALAHGNLQGFHAISDAVKADGERARQELDKFQARVMAIGQPQAAADYGHEGYGHPLVKGAAPGVKGKPKANADDPTRKLLEGQLRAFQQAIAKEQDLFQSRNQFIDLYNSQNLLSVNAYFDARKVALQEAVTNETALYDKEIAALRGYQSKSTTSKTDRAAAENKVNDLIATRERLETQAGAEGIKNDIQRKIALDTLAKQLESVNAQVLELRGNFGAAAAIHFDQQFDALKKTFTDEGNKAGLEAIEILRRAAIAQGDFQKASGRLGDTFDELNKKEAYLAIAQETGALHSLDALIEVGKARRAMIPVLEAQVQAEEAIAKAAEPDGGNLTRGAERSRLALEQLKAAADPLAASLNKTFGDDFNNALDDFVSGTKSAKDAFSSFAKSVLNDILKMGSKTITESLFGGSGGAGGLISSLFSSSGGGGGSSLAGIASLFSGFFAEGGYIPPGRWGVAGENGPEHVFGGSTGKTVVPSGAGGRVQNISVNVNASQGMSKASAQQQGRDIGVGIRQALARND